MKSRIWLIKFLLAGILLGVGLFMAFDEEIVYLMTGVILVVFALFRLKPLLKSLKKEVSRFIHLMEAIVTILLGAALIWISFQLDGDNSEIYTLIYKYGLGFVFYTRGVVYFVSTVFYNEKTKPLEFVIHIASLSIGTAIFFIVDFNPGLVGIFFLIISVIGAVTLTLDGYGGYKAYRIEMTQDEKSPSKTKEKGIDKHIPLEDKKEERTYVN
jgi:membrane glycosyltransferase